MPSAWPGAAIAIHGLEELQEQEEHSGIKGETCCLQGEWHREAAAVCPPMVSCMSG